MIIIRNFLLSSLFMVCTPTLISATNMVDSNVQEWQNNYLTLMSPEQLQFTANFLYLSYAVAIGESKVRQFITPLSRLNHAIRTKIITYQNATDDLAMLKTLLDRLSYVAGARSIYLETLKICSQYHGRKKLNCFFGTPNTQLIDAALENIQQAAQKKLIAWTNEMLADTNIQLEKSSTVMSSTSNYFQGMSTFYKNLSEGALPINLPKNQETNKAIIIFDAIIKNNNELLMLAEQGIDAINETSDHVAQLITAGAEIYKQYYTVVYNMIASPAFDARYATTMFGMHDMLPEEYASALPHPDHVFEHMLQTTKLYTQTELLQQ